MLVQMRVQSSTEEELDEQRLQAEIDTNLLGPMRVGAAFLPHLARMAGRELPGLATSAKPGAPTLINVSSGLAFVPLARFPVYCATKAAIHSWTMCLRHQLRGSSVKVIELIPPYVATELGGPAKTVPPGAPQPMPLEAFIAETMRELETDADEIAVAEAKRLVAATSPEMVKKIFSTMNG